MVGCGVSDLALAISPATERYRALSQGDFFCRRILCPIDDDKMTLLFLGGPGQGDSIGRLMMKLFRADIFRVPKGLPQHP